MLPAPVTVELRFADGASFGVGLILGNTDNGILGSNVLGGSSLPFVDVSDQVQRVNIRRGRNDVIDTYNNGTAVIQLLDDSGDYNPSNTSSPYFGQILPNRQVRISALDPNPPIGEDPKRFLFSGYVESWDYKWQPGFNQAIVTIVCSDAFRLFNLAQITTVAGASFGDTTGERVNQILDAVGWPNSQRKITGFGRLVQNDSGDARAALAALQQVEATELGAFYIDAEGDAVFETRDELSQKTVEDVFIPFFDDVPPPDFIPPLRPRVFYQQLEVVLNDQLLANEVTVERVGGTPQTVSDVDSVEKFYRRTLRRTETLDVDDNAALESASAILNNRKIVGVEIKQLTFEMLSDSTNIREGLTLDFGNSVEVRRQYSGTISIDAQFLTAVLTVQGIAHDITQGRHDVTLTTSRPLSFAFVLGSLQFGRLGQSTL